MEIKFEINTDNLEKKILNGLERKLKEKIGNVRCAEHNQLACFKKDGSSINKLTYYIEGCCQKLIDDVKKVIK